MTTKTRSPVSLWIMVGILSAVLVVSAPLFGQQSQKEQRQGFSVVKKVAVPDSLVPKFFKREYDTARVERNWNKLKKGMTQEEVFSLLGSPSKGGEYQELDASETWAYGKHYIVFNSVTERVRYWE